MKPVVGLTMGDPSGVGPEVLLKALSDPCLIRKGRFVLIGDRFTLERARSRFAPDLEFVAWSDDSPPTGRPAGTFVELLVPEGQEEVEECFGEVRPAGGAAAARAIYAAADLAISGRLNAIATAPIHKRAVELAGVKEIGHTEMLARRTGISSYSLMLVHGHMRVAHVTCHQSLRDAITGVTEEKVLATIRLTHELLRTLGIRSPRIGVAGLNPHAGEQGLMGDEDLKIIRPAVDRARRDGQEVTGPYPPDVIFPLLLSRELDAIVVQYHDQGHIPFKLLTFRHRRGDHGMRKVRGVNLMLGLPFVRTSVDHGVAFEIAGQGVADAGSMRDAILLACRLASSQIHPKV